MKTNLLILFLAIFFPIITIISVNELSIKSNAEFSAEKCTRYCHNVSCRHKPEKSTFDIIYSSSIYWLGNNTLGLGYKNMNILVFVILWPGLMFFLLSIVLLNHYLLKRLKQITVSV